MIAPLKMAFIVAQASAPAVPLAFLPRLLAGLFIVGEISEFIKTLFKILMIRLRCERHHVLA